MLELLLGDDEGPRHTKKQSGDSRLERALALPRAITFLVLLVPFAVFAFTMTALFGAASDHYH